MMALLTLPHVHDPDAWGHDEPSDRAPAPACHSERSEESTPRADGPAERQAIRLADPDERRAP